MSFAPLLLVASAFLAATSSCFAQENLSSTAAAFLPPGAHFAQLQTFDPKTGKLLAQSPAILSGHIASPKSSDIIFAYETEAKDLGTKSLFIALLHQTEAGYVKLFEATYLNRYLWVQDFATVGFGLVRLTGTSTDSVLLATALGAPLGATVEILQWNETSGFANIFPPNTAYHFRCGQQGSSWLCELRFEKYPSDKAAPPPKRLAWEKNKFHERK